MNMEEANLKYGGKGKKILLLLLCCCHTKPVLLKTMSVMQLPKSKSDDKESQVFIVFA